MRGLAVVVGLAAALLAAPASAAPGLRVWQGHGHVVNAGKTIADVSEVGLLELPNGRFAFTTLTKPVVYAFSGYGPAERRGLENHFHVDSFAAQATQDSPAQRIDDECVLVFLPRSQAAAAIDCSALPTGTYLVFTGDGHGPALQRTFKPDAPARPGGAHGG